MASVIQSAKSSLKVEEFILFYLRQGFSVVLVPVPELALIDQADLELPESPLCLSLPSVGIKDVRYHCLAFLCRV